MKKKKNVQKKRNNWANSFQITAAEAMLIGLGATSAMAQGGTSQGTFYADVLGKLEVDCSAKSSAEVKTIINANDISTVPGIECKVTTNEPVWDLTITLSSAALKTAAGAILKTAAEPNGIITLGVKYNGANTITYSSAIVNAILKNGTVIQQLNTGDQVHTRSENLLYSTPGKLANAFKPGAEAFSVDGTTEANFEIKAGIVGTEITSPAGNYTSNVTVTVEVPN